MKPWEKKKKKVSQDVSHADLMGEWLDIGEGECQRCIVVRCLYRPVGRLDLYFCAPCTQVIAGATLPDRNEDDEDTFEDVTTEAA